MRLKLSEKKINRNLDALDQLSKFDEYDTILLPEPQAADYDKYVQQSNRYSAATAFLF